MDLAEAWVHNPRENLGWIVHWSRKMTGWLVDGMTESMNEWLKNWIDNHKIKKWVNNHQQAEDGCKEKGCWFTNDFKIVFKHTISMLL